MHLDQGGACKGQKKPYTYKAVEKRLNVAEGPRSVDSGSGFVKVFAIAQSANIKIIG
jgi:hypothetical protein